MASEEPATKRNRRANFSDEEMMAVIQGWLGREAILREKFSHQVTAERKKAAWDEISRAVNAVSRVTRQREEIKKKFAEFKSVVKKKSAALKREQLKTGGGTSDVKPLNPIEEAMLGVIKEIQIADLPGLRDPGLATGDEEEAAGGTDATTAPVSPASPRPGTSGTYYSDSATASLTPLMATPEPLSPYSQTGEVVVLDEPPSQGADDHPYSHHPQTSSRRGGSSRCPRGVHASLDATLAPEMLRVHENIRDILGDVTQSITAFLPAIARKLTEILDELKSHRDSD